MTLKRFLEYEAQLRKEYPGLRSWEVQEVLRIILELDDEKKTEEAKKAKDSQTNGKG